MDEGSQSAAEHVASQRKEAFELLKLVVRENYDAERLSYGASLKPELRRRTLGGFDERLLHFDSFRRFLEAARDAGEIDLHAAPTGPDVEATPVGSPQLEKPVVHRSPQQRIRSDLWEAFVNWTDGWTRVYDRDEHRALRFPSEPVPLERADVTTLRENARADATRFVPIAPISFAEHLDWMREFVAAISDAGARRDLETALATSHPVRAFTRELTHRSDLRSEWHFYRLAQVEARIHQWVETSALDVEIHEPAPSQKAGPSGDRPAAQGGRSSERVSALRAVLHDAIDRMPEEELFKLRLPVGYVVE